MLSFLTDPRKQSLLNLPDKIGVTANLSLNYRAPTRADQVCYELCSNVRVLTSTTQFIVIKTRLIEAKGRKVKVAGTIEDLEGNILVEAS